MTRVLAIYGSHRRGQNSDILLDKVLEGIGTEDVTVKKVYASAPDIKSCAACENCYRLGRCVIKDEMLQVYEEIDKADIVVASSPVYFNTVSADMKKLIDRCQAVWAGKYRANSRLISEKRRVGYIVCTAGKPENRSSFDCTVSVFEVFYKCINTELIGSLLVSGVDDEPVRNRKYVQMRAFEAGRRLKENLKD